MAVFWCWWCYSLVLLVPLWWFVVSSVAYTQPINLGGHTQGSSARRSVSRVNRSCRASFMNVIALIIYYLCVPLGIAFTVQYFS